MSNLEKTVRAIATTASAMLTVWMTALFVADYWSDYTEYRDYSAWNHSANIAIAAIIATIGATLTVAVWELLSDRDPY